jgi:hypothetical protein
MVRATVDFVERHGKCLADFVPEGRAETSPGQAKRSPGKANSQDKAAPEGRREPMARLCLLKSAKQMVV